MLDDAIMEARAHRLFVAMLRGGMKTYEVELRSFVSLLRKDQTTDLVNPIVRIVNIRAVSLLYEHISVCTECLS
jgi:hypothetical protein